MAKFLMQETITDSVKVAARIGAGTGAGNNVDDKEVGKLYKLVAESRYDLCAAGDPIEARLEAVEAATLDGYTMGTVKLNGRLTVTFDGLQATPGTGSVAVGDYVVCGTVVAKATALSAAAKVCKATQQPGSVPADLTAAGLQARNAAYAWRVVSLGSVGTGAVGTVGVIERAQ